MLRPTSDALQPIQRRRRRFLQFFRTIPFLVASLSLASGEVALSQQLKPTGDWLAGQHSSRIPRIPIVQSEVPSRPAPKPFALVAYRDNLASQLDLMPAEPSVTVVPSMPAAVSSAYPTISNDYASIPSLPIDGRSVACRAAQNWSPAHALRARGRTIVQAFSRKDASSREAAAALNNFLHRQSVQQEDIGAATALRAYYSRIGLALQMELVAEAHELLDRERTGQQMLLDSGVTTGVDLSSFERKNIELQDKAAQLDSQDRQLASVLEHMSQSTYEAHMPGVEPLEISVQQVDTQAHIAFAMSNRQDLQSWICLRSQINNETAPIIAKMLSTAVGGFSLPLPAVGPIKSLLCGNNYAELAANMRHEVSFVIRTHQDWITESVGEKCNKLQLSYRRYDLALQTLESWKARVAQLERLEEMGQSQAASAAEARSGLLTAKVDEVTRRLEAKLAEVELAEACGGIACRCCRQEAWLPNVY